MTFNGFNVISFSGPNPRFNGGLSPSGNLRSTNNSAISDSKLNTAGEPLDAVDKSCPSNKWYTKILFSNA